MYRTGFKSGIILSIYLQFQGAKFCPFRFTPPKTNMDTQNDGLEKVTPLKSGHFWYTKVKVHGTGPMYWLKKKRPVQFPTF